MSIHASLTGSDLHEPKGISTATSRQVYLADGAGSGAWALITASNLDSSTIFNINTVTIAAYFPDTGAASTIYIPIPYNCTVTKVYASVGVALATANSVLTCKNNANSTMSGGTLTLTFSGSAAGDTFNCTPVSNNTFTAGQRMAITSDGGSTTVSPTWIILKATVTS